MLRFIPRAEKHAMEGYPLWLSSLLHARGIRTPEEAEVFLNPCFKQLHDPYLLKDMEKAVALIMEAAKKKKRAVVYGDYDVDGMCSSAILCETLISLGIKTIAYIPERHKEGYGLNEAAIRSLAAQAELLITCDCGITAVHEVEVAKELGMQVIITDHHTLPDLLPPADALINPLLGEYPYRFLCGAATAWKLCMALKGEVWAKQQLDLVALATMADMVPLQGENRVLAALGLEQMATTKREGLKALIEVAGMSLGTLVSGEQVAFRLAPRLNAGGRLETADAALELLRTPHRERAQSLAAHLNELNTRRRAEEDQVIQSAKEQLMQEDISSLYAMVAWGEGWNSGVVGLAAGRIAEEYGIPSVVLSQNGDMLTGSARSAAGVDLYACLKQCEDLFVRFGGHRQAAGLTLPLTALEAFKTRFSAAVEACFPQGLPLPQAYYDAEIPLDEVSPETADALQRLAPFGEGNPSPLFLVRDAQVVSSRVIGSDGKHMRLSVSKGSGLREGVGFGLGHRVETLPPKVDLLFSIQKNEFRGKVSGECLIRRIEPGTEVFFSDETLEKSILLQELRACVANNTMHPIRQQVDEELPPQGTRGTLFLCRTAHTAEKVRRRFTNTDACVRQVTDLRAFHTVLCQARVSDIKVPFKHIVLCDGLIHPAESGYIHQVVPGALLTAWRMSEPLKAYLQELKISVEELRNTYVRLRNEGLPALKDMEENKRYAALLILEELGLTSGTSGFISILPLRKCNPEESPLFRALQGIKEV